MRLATYNVEWFDALFDDEGRVLHSDPSWSARYNVTKQAQVAALVEVFRAMDADAVMVIEAPDTGRKRSTVRALSAFAAHAGLRTRDVVTGFANDTQQEIALLYDAQVLSARHAPRTDPEAPRFDGTLRIDLDTDASTDPVVFSKPPLELQVTRRTGQSLHVIGAHLKSKAPHGAKSPDDATRIAIANRRKQLAQAIWLRRRIEARLRDGTSLIVLGDLNDGPGLDVYEKLFGRSSVEILLGPSDASDVQLYDPHAALGLQRRLGATPTTARFFISSENRYLQALLDYAMVSPDLRAQAPKWRIWHPFDDPACWTNLPLRTALLTASDHFPVTLDLP